MSISKFVSYSDSFIESEYSLSIQILTSTLSSISKSAMVVVNGGGFRWYTSSRRAFKMIGSGGGGISMSRLFFCEMAEVE
jgi:hypothetical protein